MPNLLEEDLDHVLERTSPLWEELRRARVFVTGGSGFFGCWLLETALWANERLNLGIEIAVLARDYRKFVRKAPHLATHPRVWFIEGDVRSFEFPEGEFTHIIHAATDSTLKLTPENRVLVADTIVEGTRRVLDFAKHCRARRLLFTSSGAVYGPQPAGMDLIPEDYGDGRPASSYAEGKRVAESLCMEAESVEATIARCFAFVGPHLPLDAHFAAGNFIRDLLSGRSIAISGDGTPTRSYLYAADLAVWLWTILLRGEARRPYNVGSEQEVSIEQLARAVASTAEPPAQVTLGRAPTPGAPAQRYIPSTSRARQELDLRETFDIHEAIRRTVRFHRILAEADEKLDGTLWQTFKLETPPSAKADLAISSQSLESTITAA
jgi:dTDP-glucose 4,6-dehydratase